MAGRRGATLRRRAVARGRAAALKSAALRKVNTTVFLTRWCGCDYGFLALVRDSLLLDQLLPGATLSQLRRMQRRAVSRHIVNVLETLPATGGSWLLVGFNVEPRASARQILNLAFSRAEPNLLPPRCLAFSFRLR